MNEDDIVKSIVKEILNLNNSLFNVQQRLNDMERPFLINRLKIVCEALSDRAKVCRGDNNTKIDIVYQNIAYMSIENIANRRIPIRSIEWRPDGDYYICATIRMIIPKDIHVVEAAVSFPIDCKTFDAYVNNLRDRTLKIKTNLHEELIKEKNDLLKKIEKFNENYPCEAIHI
jgi:hypothetical protein